MLGAKECFNKYWQKRQQLDKLTVKLFTVEKHIENNPTDYQSIIAKFNLKASITRVEYRLQELEKNMEVCGFDQM